MNFGFIQAALKSAGAVLLPVAEQAGTAAATAVGGPVAGTLVSLAVSAINGAITKHGTTAPASAPAQQTSALSQLVVNGAQAVENITVGLAKKSDVMDFLESHASDIANLVLGGAGKKVVDLDRFTKGADSIVEGVLDVMKAIGEVPTSTPMTNPVVLTAPPASTPSLTPVVAPPAPVPASPSPAPAVQTAGVITINASEVQPLITKLLSLFGVKA